MVIQFVCPNGHKIHCGEERAGMAARCPRCGARFRIPTLEEIRAGQLQARQADIPTPDAQRAASLTESRAPAADVALGPASTAEEIEFFCPNDHRLHGPASLQGERGICPECGAEFRIPSLDEWEEAVEELQEAGDQGVAEPVPGPPPPLPPSAAQAEPAPPLPPVSTVAGGVAGGATPGSLADRSAKAGVSQAVGPVGAPAVPAAQAGSLATPLRELLPTLWEYKLQGASIEIQYGPGQRLHPDRFLEGLSAGSHAVFADRAADGSYTLTAVPWQAIVAVVVRGIQELAPEHGG